MFTPTPVAAFWKRRIITPPFWIDKAAHCSLYFTANVTPFLSKKSSWFPDRLITSQTGMLSGRAALLIFSGGCCHVDSDSRLCSWGFVEEIKVSSVMLRITCWVSVVLLVLRSLSGLLDSSSQSFSHLSIQPGLLVFFVSATSASHLPVCDVTVHVYSSTLMWFSRVAAALNHSVYSEQSWSVHTRLTLFIS